METEENTSGGRAGTANGNRNGTGGGTGGPAADDVDYVDDVDRIMEQWRRERPEVDMTAAATLGRFAQLTLLLQQAIEEVFARHGLQRGEFDVLAALRRSGPPYVLTPSSLAATLMMSRAGMTGRLDRLESAGLVERSLDPDDRRSFRIALTDRGRTVVDAAVTEHAANETRLLGALTARERRTFDALLRKLLGALAEGAG